MSQTWIFGLAVGPVASALLLKIRADASSDGPVVTPPQGVCKERCRLTHCCHVRYSLRLGSVCSSVSESLRCP